MSVFRKDALENLSDSAGLRGLATAPPLEAVVGGPAEVLEPELASASHNDERDSAIDINDIFPDVH